MEESVEEEIERHRQARQKEAMMDQEIARGIAEAAEEAAGIVSGKDFTLTHRGRTFAVSLVHLRSGYWQGVVREGGIRRYERWGVELDDVRGDCMREALRCADNDLYPNFDGEED